MACKLQISVDEQLNRLIQEGAKKMGLSVSSYVRSVLLSAFSKTLSPLEASMEDLANGRVETLTLDQFKKNLKSME